MFTPASFTSDQIKGLYPVGSHNGLLCLFGDYLTNNYKEILFYLWNPATRTLSNKTVFLRKSNQYWRFAFGYDNSTDTYKIVAFDQKTNEARIFSFGDKVWRNIESFPMVFPNYRDLLFSERPSIKHGVHVSGTLSWLAIRNEFQYAHQIDWTNLCVIISLDLSTETYLQLLLPQGFGKVQRIMPTLAVLMDSLCCSHDFHETHLIIWQMKEFGVQESWTQFIEISYQSLPMLPYHYRLLLFPLCLSENDNTLILAGWGENQQAIPIFYNLRDNRVKNTRLTNEIEWFLTKDYVESLVSTT